MFDPLLVLFVFLRGACHHRTFTCFQKYSIVFKMEIMDIGENELQTHTIQARFVSDTGEEAGPPIDLPIQVDVQQLELICNALLKNVSKFENIRNVPQ